MKLSRIEREREREMAGMSVAIYKQLHAMPKQVGSSTTEWE